MCSEFPLLCLRDTPLCPKMGSARNQAIKNRVSLWPCLCLKSCRRRGGGRLAIPTLLLLGALGVSCGSMLGCRRNHSCHFPCQQSARDMMQPRCPFFQADNSKQSDRLVPWCTQVLRRVGCR